MNLILTWGIRFTTALTILCIHDLDVNVGVISDCIISRFLFFGGEESCSFDLEKAMSFEREFKIKFLIKNNFLSSFQFFVVKMGTGIQKKSSIRLSFKIIQLLSMKIFSRVQPLKDVQKIPYILLTLCIFQYIYLYENFLLCIRLVFFHFIFFAFESKHF